MFTDDVLSYIKTTVRVYGNVNAFVCVWVCVCVCGGGNVCVCLCIMERLRLWSVSLTRLHTLKIVYHSSGVDNLLTFKS